MNSSEANKLIALGALFQAADCVSNIARTGAVNSTAFDTLAKSLLVTDAPTTLDIYESTSNLHIGLKALEKYYLRQHKGLQLETQRYVMSLLLITKKLINNKAMMEKLELGIDSAKRQNKHYGSTHPNMIASFADTYVNTIGTFSYRIQVKGDERYLSQPTNVAKIRAMLLAGVRATVLWRQLGGSLWQLLFFKKQCASRIQKLTEINSFEKG